MHNRVNLINLSLECSGVRRLQRLPQQNRQETSAREFQTEMHTFRHAQASSWYSVHRMAQMLQTGSWVRELMAVGWDRPLQRGLAALHAQSQIDPESFGVTIARYRRSGFPRTGWLCGRYVETLALKMPCRLECSRTFACLMSGTWRTDRIRSWLLCTAFLRIVLALIPNQTRQYGYCHILDIGACV